MDVVKPRSSVPTPGTPCHVSYRCFISDCLGGKPAGGSKESRAYIETLGIHHNVILVKVLGGEQIQFLLRFGGSMASVVREN